MWTPTTSHYFWTRWENATRLFRSWNGLTRKAPMRCFSPVWMQKRTGSDPTRVSRSCGGRRSAGIIRNAPREPVRPKPRPGSQVPKKKTLQALLGLFANNFESTRDAGGSCSAQSKHTGCPLMRITVCVLQPTQSAGSPREHFMATLLLIQVWDLREKTKMAYLGWD